jgi:hypothetical protein
VAPPPMAVCSLDVDVNKALQGLTPPCRCIKIDWILTIIITLGTFFLVMVIVEIYKSITFFLPLHLI